MMTKYTARVLSPGRGPARRHAQKAPEYVTGPAVDFGLSTPSPTCEPIMVITPGLRVRIGRLTPSVWCLRGSEEYQVTLVTGAGSCMIDTPTKVVHTLTFVSKRSPAYAGDRVITSLNALRVRTCFLKAFFSKIKIKNYAASGVRTWYICAHGPTPYPLRRALGWSVWVVIVIDVCVRRCAYIFVCMGYGICIGYFSDRETIFYMSSVVCPPAGSK